MYLWIVKKKSLAEVLNENRKGMSFEVIARGMRDWFEQNSKARPELYNQNVTSESVRRWFRGERSQPKSIILEAMSHVLKVPFADLLLSAGYSLPDELLNMNNEKNIVKRIEYALNGIDKIEDYQLQQIEEFLTKYHKEHKK